MAPAVTALLDRVFFPGLTAWDVFGNSPELGEVSNRAGSQFFGCRRSPQRQNPWQPQAATFNHQSNSKNVARRRVAIKFPFKRAPDGVNGQGSPW